MFARTDRLLLRPGWMEDAPALAKAIGEEAIIRNLARAPWPYRLKDAQAFLSTSGQELPSFIILERGAAAPALVGGIGLIADPGGGAELGYWIARDRWGRGYAAEAGRAVLAIARHGLRLGRITASHLVDNPASGRVLEKLGFEATGEIGVRYSMGRGEDVPSKAYALDLRGSGCQSADPERMAA